MIAKRVRPSALRVGDTFVHRPARNHSWLKPLAPTTAASATRPDAPSVMKRIEVALQNFVQRYVHRPARNHSWMKSLAPTTAESAARPDTASVLKRLDRSYQHLVQRYVDSLFGDQHRRSLQHSHAENDIERTVFTDGGGFGFDQHRPVI